MHHPRSFRFPLMAHGRGVDLMAHGTGVDLMAHGRGVVPTRLWDVIM